MPSCWGPEHRAHTTPHTHQPRPTGERQRCAPALNAPHPPPQDPSARGHTGTAASPSHQRLGGVRGSSAVWTAVRPDNQRGVPSRAGEVRAHWPWVTTFGASRDRTQPTPPGTLEVREGGVWGGRYGGDKGGGRRGTAGVWGGGTGGMYGGEVGGGYGGRVRGGVRRFTHKAVHTKGGL